jgi:hypothetical protein
MLCLSLKGVNYIENSTYAVTYQGETAIGLTFSTDQNASGKLVYTKQEATLTDLNSAFSGFSSYNLDNGLTSEASGTNVNIFVPLSPVVAEETDGEEENAGAQIDYSDDQSICQEVLVNAVVQDVLYTLVDKQEAHLNDDGFEQGHIDKEGVRADIVVINSIMSDDDVATVANTVGSGGLAPGTDNYADIFKGLTFLLPKGSGKIYLKSIITDNSHWMKVRIGNQLMLEVNTAGKFEDRSIAYQVDKPTYVFIYTTTQGTTSAPSMATRRIGPKGTVSGGLGGLSISANEIKVDTSNELKAADITKAMTGSTVTVKDLTMKTIAEGAFAGLASKELAYIDLSGTSIKGVTVSRSSGAFKGISANTFIYMPAGNTTTEPNVVIGGTCANMQMDGNGNSPFRVAKNFTASKATLNRSFADGKRSTVYLPYAVSQDAANALGSFYTFTGITGTTVNMKKVTTGGLVANTPYIYVPEGSISKVEVSNASVKSGTSLSLNFVGTYEKIVWPVDQMNNYCFVGEEKGGFQVGMFARMGAGSWVAPFRAYMRKPAVSAPQLDINWIDNPDEVETNGIKSVMTEGQKAKTAVSGWFTIDGMKLKDAPTQKGLYIYQGKKIVK